ncbi:MAG: hypothetical protein O2782_18565 [bacterium]|nr:hypothetical protein [bacterium]
MARRFDDATGFVIVRGLLTTRQTEAIRDALLRNAGEVAASGDYGHDRILEEVARAGLGARAGTSPVAPGHRPLARPQRRRHEWLARSGYGNPGVGAVWVNPAQISQLTNVKRLRWAMRNGAILPHPAPELIVTTD